MGISLLPEAVQEMVDLQAAVFAASVTTRLPISSTQSRQQSWWLHYCTLEFDVSEVLIDSLGGSLAGSV